MRIGLISDTHMPGSLETLWPQALQALQGVDYILHAGDLHTTEIVDELSNIAPTYVSIGNGDVGLVDERLREHWMLQLGSIQIGLIHRLPSPTRKSAEAIGRYVESQFGSQPDVVVFGHTHFEGVYQVGTMLCVNPGSPTLPRNQTVRMGTIGYLDIADGMIRASIHQITTNGMEPHGSVEPIQNRVMPGGVESRSRSN